MQALLLLGGGPLAWVWAPAEERGLKEEEQRKEEGGGRGEGEGGERGRRREKRWKEREEEPGRSDLLGLEEASAFHWLKGRCS